MLRQSLGETDAPVRIVRATWMLHVEISKGRGEAESVAEQNLARRVRFEHSSGVRDRMIPACLAHSPASSVDSAARANQFRSRSVLSGDLPAAAAGGDLAAALGRHGGPTRAMRHGCTRPNLGYI